MVKNQSAGHNSYHTALIAVDNIAVDNLSGVDKLSTSISRPQTALVVSKEYFRIFNSYASVLF